MKTKVILADSMDLVVTGLQVILHQQTNVEISGTFQALTPLLDALAGQHPDVILLDDRLEPALDVLALVERVQNAAPRAQIIVLSNLQDGLIVQELLACGVAGYLYKGDVISDCLSQALRNVLADLPYLSPTANTEYLIVMQSDRARWQLDAEGRDVLRMLANGYRCQEIALLRGMLLRRVYWVCSKLRDRFGAQTNEHMIARAAEEGFLP